MEVTKFDSVCMIDLFDHIFLHINRIGFVLYEDKELHSLKIN